MASDNKMIYLVVTPFFPSHYRWQGAFVLDQVKAIKRHSQYDVIVFKTHSWGDIEDDYEIDGIKVYCIRPLLMPSYILNGITEGLVGRLFVKKLNNIGIELKKVAYIHCHTVNHAAFGFGVKSVYPNAKVILQFHDPDPLNLRNGRWANNLLNKRFKARKSSNAINRADIIICISKNVNDVITSFPKPRSYEVFDSAKDSLRGLETFPALRPQKVYILNNGVDCNMFTVHPRAKSEVFKIGCVANFVDWKNHITLLRAFKVLVNKGYTDIKLSLLGSGDTKESIEKYINDNNLNSYIDWPCEVHHDKLPDYYNTLDLFVLPSRFEGFGCVYTEAHACGVPFICNENQGASECICESERHLWLAKDMNHLQLAGLIERQYHERNEQHLCKEIDIDVLIPQYLEYIQKQ